MLGLDATTLADYEAAVGPSARAQVVIDALSGTVTVKVYDGSANLKGSGTMAAPWATQTNGIITVGEVTSFSVSSSGTPAPDWYLRFEGGSGRWLRGSFGLAGSGQDFTWSLPTWVAGTMGELGAVSVGVQSNTAPTLSGAPTDVEFYEGIGGTYNFGSHGYDEDGDPIQFYLIGTQYSGVSISTAGLFTVTTSAAAAVRNLTIRVTDGQLSSDYPLTLTIRPPIYPVGPQYARPISNVVTTGFTGGYDRLDESSPVDTAGEFAFGANNTAATLEVLLSTVQSDPPGGNVTVRYRIAKVKAGTLDGGGNAVNMTASVRQGASVLATDTAQSATGTWTTYSFTFSRALVTNWSDLRFRITTTASGGNSNTSRGGAISWVEVETPADQAPQFQVAPPSATLPNTGGTIQFTATDPNGDAITYRLSQTRAGITINDPTSGLVTVTSTAANTVGEIRVRATDVAGLFSEVSCAVTVASQSPATAWPTQGTVDYLPVVPATPFYGADCVAGSGRTYGVTAATWQSRSGTTEGVTTPTIRTVSNCATSGDGSLKAALDAHNSGSGPSVIVFTVAGTIDFGATVTSNSGTGNLRITRGQLTVAGQTAPAPGIEIKGAGFFAAGSSMSDVLVQHVKVRSGYGPQDSVEITQYSESTTIRRVVFDHCSMQYGRDSNGDIYSATADCALVHCILADPVAVTVAEQRNQIFGQDSGQGYCDRAQVYRSLIANGSERNPSTHARGSLVLNTVVHNPNYPGISTAPCGLFPNGMTVSGRAATIMNNLYQIGPDGEGGYGSPWRGYTTNFIAWFSGNRYVLANGSVKSGYDITDVNANGCQTGFINGTLPSFAASPAGAVALPPGMVLATVDQLPALVPTMGARAANRSQDLVDTRILAQWNATRSGTPSGYKWAMTAASQTALQSFASSKGTSAWNDWPQSAAIDLSTYYGTPMPTGTAAATIQASGYTALEEWLQARAATVEQVS
jgi:hypothetical protein